MFRCVQTDLDTENFGQFGPNFGVGAAENGIIFGEKYNL
jgi:hypothetical protein